MYFSQQFSENSGKHCGLLLLYTEQFMTHRGKARSNPEIWTVQKPLC